MLVSNNWYSVTCQSCCCTTYEVDLNKVNFMSRKCLCRLTACSHDVRDMTETPASCENYQCPQLQDNVSDIRTRDVPRSCVSVSSGIRHAHIAQCTCRAESHLPTASATHCTACMCHCVLKPPESLTHVVGYDQCVNKASVTHYCYQHCCTCIGNSSQDPAMSSCQQSVSLSDSTSTASVCHGCNKFAQVNRPEPVGSWQPSRHSDLYSTEKEQKKAVSICRPGQLGSVIMDVNEWQRRHIEQLDRQKLEVCITLCLSEMSQEPS